MSVASTESSINDALLAATETYGAVQNSSELSETFHEAGRTIEPLKAAFDAYHSLVDTSEARYSIQDKEPLQSTLDGATRYLTILKEVQATREQERVARYESVVGSSTEDMVESLVLAMIKSFLELAEGREDGLDFYITGLQDAKTKLEGMEPSVKNKTKGNTYSHFGSGHQFNATGGVQHNNTGSGQQFSGPIHGGIHFGGSK